MILNIWSILLSSTIDERSSTYENSESTSGSSIWRKCFGIHGENTTKMADTNGVIEHG